MYTCIHALPCGSRSTNLLVDFCKLDLGFDDSRDVLFFCNELCQFHRIRKDVLREFEVSIQRGQRVLYVEPGDAGDEVQFPSGEG